MRSRVCWRYPGTILLAGQSLQFVFFSISKIFSFREKLGSFGIILKVSGGGDVRVAIDSTTTAHEVITQVETPSSYPLNFIYLAYRLLNDWQEGRQAL